MGERERERERERDRERKMVLFVSGKQIYNVISLKIRLTIAMVYTLDCFLH